MAKPRPIGPIVERLIFSVGVHGPALIFEERPLRLLRWLYIRDRPRFEQLVWALQDGGLERGVVLRLVDERVHTRECACWDCLGRFHSSAMKWAARLRIQRELGYRRDLDEQSARLTADEHR